MYKQIIAGLALAALIPNVQGEAANTDQDRISALEERVQYLSDELELRDMNAADSSNPMGGFRFGGYGEVHANFEENGNSKFDIHRLVMYVGYDFADWIVLNSEVELEHAFVTDGAGGELVIEQLNVDFLFNEAVNLRVGRLLAPIGIINQKHEPTLFFGVERPAFSHDLIPTTWFPEGAGVFGSPTEWLSYQAYVVGGLDGSGFDGEEGIRGGRTEERSGLGDPAFTGRMDFYPIVGDNQELRIGLSGYYGGTDNADGGGGNGIDNTFGLYSADFEYDVSRFQFRGVLAQGFNSDADSLNAAFGNDVADEILGWYLEGGVGVLPESCKTGKLADADVIPFVRYEWYDTQHKVPTGVTKDGANERTIVTVGVNFPLTQQFVLKADYQIRSSEGATDPNNLFNLGMGWAF